MGGKRRREALFLLLLKRNEEEPLPDVKEERDHVAKVACGSLNSDHLTRFLSAPVRRLHGHVWDDERHD